MKEKFKDADLEHLVFFTNRFADNSLVKQWKVRCTNMHFFAEASTRKVSKKRASRLREWIPRPGLAAFYRWAVWLLLSLTCHREKKQRWHNNQIILARGVRASKVGDRSQRRKIRLGFLAFKKNNFVQALSAQNFETASMQRLPLEIWQRLSFKNNPFSVKQKNVLKGESESLHIVPTPPPYPRFPPRKI